MLSKYERPIFIKSIINTLQRYVYTITLDGELVFDRTKKELAKELKVTLATLKKYLDVYSQHKNMPYKFIDKVYSNKDVVKSETVVSEILPAKEEKVNILSLLPELLANYIEYKTANNISKLTLSNIERVINRFCKYIVSEFSKNSKLSISDIDKYFLSAYLNYLSANKIAKNTQKLHLTIIKNFLLFIADYDVSEFGVLKSQINGLSVKTEQKETPFLSDSEQAMLKEYLAKLDKENRFLSHRNSLLIKLLLYTGARISEILEISWVDLTEIDDPEHGLVYSILLKGKGNKERYTYILYDTIRANVEFLQENAKNQTYVITSTHDNQCNRSVLWSIVKEILNRVGITKTGLHLFRHTCARNLVKNNVNLSTIKELLGHANITITAQFYAKADEKAKKTALIQNIKT